MSIDLVARCDDCDAPVGWSPTTGADPLFVLVDRLRRKLENKGLLIGGVVWCRGCLDDAAIVSAEDLERLEARRERDHARTCGDVEPHTHPSLVCYTQHNCKCEECTEISAEYQSICRERRAIANGRPFVRRRPLRYFAQQSA